MGVDVAPTAVGRRQVENNLLTAAGTGGELRLAKVAHYELVVSGNSGEVLLPPAAQIVRHSHPGPASDEELN